ncbi:MAG TPA: hypothetical protein VIZ32_22440, partial [Vicinamibacterales bacterium]
MPNRRHFVRTLAGAATGMCVTGRDAFFERVSARQAPAPRQVTIAGQRVRVIDIHCHCIIDVSDVVKGTPFEESAGGRGNQILGPQRLELMDRTGVDVQA